MKRIATISLFAAFLAISYVTANENAVVSGQGKMKFKVLYKSDHLPAEAQKVLKGAHGGFAVDLSKGKGETYFALKGAGIIQISADLKSTRMLDTPDEMKNTNLHNATIWHAQDKSSHLLFPGNESNKVFVTGLDGKLDTVLSTPAAGVDLGSPVPNEYFKTEGKFIPTDVEQLDGKLYITTGYSKLDYVLTARILKTNPVELAWNNLSFGGKGKGQGQFDTGHGITVPPKMKRLDIADRANGEIDRFSPDGKYLSTLTMPKDSFPCDTYYLGKYVAIASLNNPDKTKGAAIYILEDDKVISTILPKEELGLTNFMHIHNAVLRQIGKKYYVIAQAWNPGDFAILEQVN
jgi:hypothetical protein